MTGKGMIYLVGAGPGDAGLLTLRGAELLRRADVVVYDALVNTELLHLAPKSAEIIYGGKRARDHATPQKDLNHLLIGKAREGKAVYGGGRCSGEREDIACSRRIVSGPARGRLAHRSKTLQRDDLSRSSGSSQF